ncbi:hypothetical protein AMATHDRAFT_68792 [Amanita thiersii Skay4041]|uniref:Methyltransferase type 11 domain-containing protein n=1 Tax=Amanita thiersii Skay4041 TaxID=703135 RepID=A0A2A9N8V5_9AGAR|nr:hypothetical protein AMATHDRAFT_68792 [Amanita thiersii Skay4041]
MATFAKAGFNASVYSAARPTYPGKLFERILGYHKHSPDPRYDLALDLGCGTGQATRHLMPFAKVIAVDPSEPMLAAARAEFTSGPWASDTDKVRFVQASAEDLSGVVPDASVDLIISAQSAHWFDWTKVWPETRRVLRKGGSAAFWIYSEFRLSSHLGLSPLITSYAQGSDPRTSLGPHFQRPGRTILENHLLQVPDPSAVLLPTSTSASGSSPDSCGLGDLERAFFAGPHLPTLNLPPATPKYHPTLPRISHNPVILTNPNTTWLDLLAYFRSWSSLHTYLERYPEDATRPADERFLADDVRVVEEARTEAGEGEGNGDSKQAEIVQVAEALGVCTAGDIGVRFWKDLREGVKQDGGKTGLLDKIGIEWPVAMILVRRL